MPELLTMKQVAEATGTSVWTVRRRIADGTLIAHRVGPRQIRIERDSVTRILTPIGIGGVA
ncbi:helix-turn-helix domain-containing protein [Mycobacterium avium subsp. hominissuis]|nr:helix-turn-helix domain-containing protein [Mycobacterium avium subsp. hominissuis]